MSRERPKKPKEILANLVSTAHWQRVESIRLFRENKCAKAHLYEIAAATNEREARRLRIMAGL